MTLFANTVLGDTWRLAVSLLVLLVLAVLWYFVVSNITPFAGKPESSEGKWPFRRLQRVTVICDVILFVWIVLEGALLIPYMLIRYGLH
jgi:hypothetical protein